MIYYLSKIYLKIFFVTFLNTEFIFLFRPQNCLVVKRTCHITPWNSVEKVAWLFKNLFQENDFKVRVELIKSIANKVITELKTRAETCYTDMFDWLGVRFQKEINSIKNLCNYIKFRIEHSKKIKKELILVQDDFIINAVSNFAILLYDLEMLNWLYRQIKLNKAKIYNFNFLKKRKLVRFLKSI